jgi:hypothetical protein
LKKLSAIIKNIFHTGRWYMLVIPAVGRLTQEDNELEA